MRWHHVPVAVLAAATLLAAWLGIRAQLAAGRHDVPAPAGEPRAEVVVVIDLDPRRGCDEAFDLALYDHPGVELVTWDARRSCRSRRATVKYLPARIRRAALLERIGRLSRSMKVE
jgi:hypothetical protein